MQLKPGSRLASQVCATELIVVKAPADDVDIRCGGAPVVAAGTDADAGLSLSADFSDGTAMGKRYSDDDLGLEVLCTKPGDGSLSLGDAPLLQKDAKPLPSSD